MQSFMIDTGQSRDRESRDHLVKTLWVKGVCGKTWTSMINNPELLPPGPSWLPQIHPECDLCRKHRMDTLDLPVCRASIVTANLLTQSHSHTTSQASPGV